MSSPAPSQSGQVDRLRFRNSVREFETSVWWEDELARAKLPDRVRCTVTGPRGAPIIVALGGISANADVVATHSGEAGWWSSLFQGASMLSRHFRIVGLDFASDPDGTFAPSPRDQAQLITEVTHALGASEPFAVIGASYGGMVALAWAERFQPSNTRLVVISADAIPHPMATALRSIQRNIVEMGRRHACVIEALTIARSLAMVGYRTASEFRERFLGGIKDADPTSPSEPGAYLAARGAAFVRQMSPGTFLSLSASIDRQHVVPQSIRSPALLIGIEEDQIVPPIQMRELARQWGGSCQLHIVSSIYGHDAFLKETEALDSLIGRFLERPRS